MTIDGFLEHCVRCAAARGISEARLSTLLFNDGKKIAALRAGADVGVKTLARAMDILRQLAAPPSAASVDDPTNLPDAIVDVTRIDAREIGVGA